ncbi:MAG: hypothetical protein RLZZ502_1934 [Pseudomonadota bacterium]|jgi:citrate lyase subunit beta/citryl-CoA lyase
MNKAHPSQVLQATQAYPVMPVVDHYCGTAERINKALTLQLELAKECGANVMDVTLDCEDGAPVGREHEHAEMVAAMAAAHFAKTGIKVAVRVHPVDHPAHADDVKTVLTAGHALAHMMIPKVESVSQVAQVAKHTPKELPLHALIESAQAVSQAQSIAGHPQVASLSFGLMDFVSSHQGAIPATAMSLSAVGGQFDHPLIMHAKIAISVACHAEGKIPSHAVVTEFKDTEKMSAMALLAAQRLGYLRMWSIHPAQIRPILAAFAPSAAEVHTAVEILLAAQAADWAPINYQNTLHDRASYRYYWELLQKARRTGAGIPALAQSTFF